MNMKLDGKTIIFDDYQTMAEAMYVKDALEQNGIPSFVSDENVVQLYPMFSSPLGGIKVHIFEEDKARAEAVLKAMDEAEATEELGE